jgi:transposase-like protein
MVNKLVCPRCQGTHCTRNGLSRGHRRFECQDCGWTFAETVGTPLDPELEPACGAVALDRARDAACGREVVA